jgi:hypothetical protein
MGKKERKKENFPKCLFFCSSFVVRKRWRRFRACAVILAGIGTTTLASGGRICGPVAAGGVGRGGSKVVWRKVLFLSLVFRSSRSRSKESAWHYSERRGRGSIAAGQCAKGKNVESIFVWILKM